MLAKTKMSNPEVIRQAMKSLRTGETFMVKSFAKKLKVKDKAVANALTGMVQSGALTKVKDATSLAQVYTVDAAGMAAHYVKYPSGALHMLAASGKPTKQAKGGRRVQRPKNKPGPLSLKDTLDKKIDDLKKDQLVLDLQVADIQVKIDALGVARDIL